MYANLSKCSFYDNRIYDLGHIILEEEISMDPEKIIVVMEWKTPNNVSEVISFMELAWLAGYYRRIIEGFSTLDHPITSL